MYIYHRHIEISPIKKGLEKGLRSCCPAAAKSTCHICPKCNIFLLPPVCSSNSRHTPCIQRLDSSPLFSVHSDNSIFSLEQGLCWVSPHHTENWIYVFPEKELRGLSSNSSIYSMCLWAFYIFPGSVLIFGCSKIDRLILKSLSDIWVWELGDRTL